jgi:hypothetical protein
MILCPTCGSLAHLNTYFGAYMCEKCTWKDYTFNKLRIAGDNNIWQKLEKWKQDVRLRNI